MALKEKLMQLYYRDEHITHRPITAIRDYTRNLSAMTPENRIAALDYVKRYADYFYSRQNKSVPSEIAASVKELEQRVMRLNTRDAARKVLEHYGSPRAALETFLRQSNARGNYFHPAEKQANYQRPAEHAQKQAAPKNKQENAQAEGVGYSVGA
jgi:hypothetical protein